MFFHRKKDVDQRKDKKKEEEKIVHSLGDSKVSAIVAKLDSLNEDGASSSVELLQNKRTKKVCGSNLEDFGLSIKKEEITDKRSFSLLKDLPNLSLPALIPVQVNQRTLVVQRNVTGDFGFNIRRTQISDGNGKMKSAVFAEPNKFTHGPPRPNEIRNNLLPGDQLIKICGKSVDSLSREELLHLIQTSGDQIELVVRGTPELAEFFDRQRGIRDVGDSLVLPSFVYSHPSEDQDGNEEEKYWLIHKNGYTSVRLLEQLSDGKVRIDVMGREMTVDVTDVDKANHLASDRIEDLSRLAYINETSIIHVLRYRYGSNLLCTMAGSPNLICMSSDYQHMCDKLITLFKGCRRQQMPPHIFAFAQQIYRTMQMTGRNQCVLTTGVSGSGKSLQLRNICRYICDVAGWTKSLTYDKVSSALGILEAFGNCTTQLNQNASRFAQLFTLSFDNSASLKCANLQAFLLEDARVCRSMDNETNFHIFYYLLEGSDEKLIETLHLQTIGKPIYIPLTRQEDKDAARLGWNHLTDALNSLAFSDIEKQAIFATLAAILHLRYAGATQGQAQRSHFIRVNNAEHAASLLGIDLEQLSSAIFRGKTSFGTNTTYTSRQSMSNKSECGEEALNRFVSALYSELFDAIISLINRGLGAKNASGGTTSITIIDIPGSNFSRPWIERDRKPSNLNDLIYNYVNERIIELFYDTIFTKQLEFYAREQVDVDFEQPVRRPHDFTRLIDQKQQLLNSVDIEMRSEEKRGLLCILDEEVYFPGATDESFFERIFIHLSDSNLIQRANKPYHLQINHCSGTNPIIYNTSGWVKMAHSGTSVILPLLSSSKNVAISSLFLPFGNIQNSSDKMKSRRTTQTVKMDSGKLATYSGLFSKLSVELDYIISVAQRSGGLHFIHCLQQIVETDAHQSTEFFDVPFVRSQIRSLFLVEAARASNKGFPEKYFFKDFRRRFHCLIGDESSINEFIDDRAAVTRILQGVGIFEHRYRLGLSQVLLRSDVMDELEERREVCLSGIIEHFQQACRQYLSRKWLGRRRIVETAIRCIQRNGLVYLKVREWTWWRLYIRTIPLLVATRSDREAEEWQKRLRTLEALNSELRNARTRLDGRVEELEEMLVVESNNTKSLNDALEQEIERRIKAEKQIILLQQRIPDEMRVSSMSSSQSRIESIPNELESKLKETQKEIARLRNSEDQLKLRAQKAVENLKDAESQILEFKAKNESVEKKYENFDLELKAMKKENEEEKTLRMNFESELKKLTALLEKKTSDLQVAKAENGELRQNLARLRKDIGEDEDESGVDHQNLQKTRRQLELKCKEQEEELDEMDDKIELLEQNITRLEIGSEKLRADRARDNEAKEKEIEELRAQYQRRQKAFEEQLGDLQEANSSLLKQNRMLEGRLRESDTYSSASSSSHYKRDFKKVRALLRDTQTVLARERENSSQHVLIRQLQEQLEDVEVAKLSALKSRYHLESELADLRTQLEAALASKNAAENRCLNLLKEKNAAQALAEEHDEQLQNLMRKYKAAVQQNSVDSIKLADQYEQMADLEKDKEKLKEQLDEANSSLDFVRLHSVEKHKLQLADQKIRDLEAKLDIETMCRIRLDTLMAKCNEEIESLHDQLNEALNNRDKETEVAHKARKDIQNLQDQVQEFRKRETELMHKYKQAMATAERCNQQKDQIDAELKLTLKRVGSLQLVLSKEVYENESDSDDTFSTHNGSVTGKS